MLLFSVFLVQVVLTTVVVAEVENVEVRMDRSITSNLDNVPDNLDQIALGACSGWSCSALIGYVPGSMGSYVLVASLTINACMVLFFSTVCLVRMVSTKLAERYSTALAIRNLSEDHPWIIGKVVTEQLTTWILILTSVSFLASTDILQYPFYGSSCTDIVALGFAANVGRYVFRILQDVYLSEHLKRWWLFCVHHLVSVFCYATMLHYGENLMLGAFGIFMEGNSFCFDILWIFKHLDMAKHHKLYISFATMAFVFSIFLRFLIPISALIYACVQQSPLSMHPVPLAALFLAAVFFLAINIWMTYMSVSKIRKSIEAQKLEKLETIVKSKVPDLINVPSSKRNILPTGSPLADVLTQRNSANGGNNVNDPNNKTDKTPFNMGLLMKYQDETEKESDFVQRRERYLRAGHSRNDSCSSISTATFIGDNREISQAEINVELDEFEDIPLSSV